MPVWNILLEKAAALHDWLLLDHPLLGLFVWFAGYVVMLSLPFVAVWYLVVRRNRAFFAGREAWETESQLATWYSDSDLPLERVVHWWREIADALSGDAAIAEKLRPDDELERLPLSFEFEDLLEEDCLFFVQCLLATGSPAGVWHELKAPAPLLTVDDLVRFLVRAEAEAEAAITEELAAYAGTPVIAEDIRAAYRRIAHIFGLPAPGQVRAADVFGKDLPLIRAGGFPAFDKFPELELLEDDLADMAKWILGLRRPAGPMRAVRDYAVLLARCREEDEAEYRRLLAQWQGERRPGRLARLARRLGMTISTRVNPGKIPSADSGCP